MAPRNGLPTGSRIFEALLNVRGSLGSVRGYSGALHDASHGEGGCSEGSWVVLERFAAENLEPAAEKQVPDRFPDFWDTARRPWESGKLLGRVWAAARPVRRRGSVFGGFLSGFGAFQRVSGPENSVPGPKNRSPTGSRIFVVPVDVPGSQGSCLGDSGPPRGRSDGEAGFPAGIWWVWVALRG